MKQRDYRIGQRGPNISEEVTAYRMELFYELRSLHNRLASVKHI
jgi:hypothetical protein